MPDLMTFVPSCHRCRPAVFPDLGRPLPRGNFNVFKVLFTAHVPKLVDQLPCMAEIFFWRAAPGIQARTATVNWSE